MRRCRRPDSSWEKQVMQQEEPGRGGPLAPLDLRKIAPIEEAAASDRLGWVGLDAARYCEAPAFEFNPPAITHHRLVLYTRPPEQLDLMYEGVKRHVPPPAGAISLVPAGSPHRVRSSGCKDALHLCLRPGLVEVGAAVSFALSAAAVIRPVPARAYGPAFCRPGPPAPPGRDGGSGRRADRRRRGRLAGRRVPGQRPGRPPDPACPGPPPA